ncbi:DNA-directed DNA polymerase [Tanacetum coccineum]
MQEVILFYNGLDVPTRQILDSKCAIPTKTIADAKVAIQEMVVYSKKWHNGTSSTRSTETSDVLAAIQAQLNNIGREIKKVNENIYAAQSSNSGILPKNVNPSYQERRQSMEESLSKFINESAKRHEENSNLIKEIQASTDAAMKNQGALIKTLEIQIGKISKKDPGSFTLPCYINHVCFDNALADLGASISVMPLSTYFNLCLDELAHTKLTVELADKTMKYPKGIAENVLVGICKFVFPVDFIIQDMSEDVKVSLILKRPFLSTAYSKIDVFKRKITFRLGDEKIIFKSIKPASSLIKRVYMLGLRECMELDLEARLMGETLVLNRSLDPLYGDYIKLNDLNVPLEFKIDQVDDLMPTIEEGELINKPMIDIIKTRNNGSFDEYCWD